MYTTLIVLDDKKLVCVHVDTYIYIYIYIYTYIYMYISTHTHTHTHSLVYACTYAIKLFQMEAMMMRSARRRDWLTSVSEPFIVAIKGSWIPIQPQAFKYLY